MDILLIAGGAPLKGTIKASGSKNGTLAIMAASLLAKGRTVLSNVPRIGDIYTMVDMLRALGADCEFSDDGVVTIDATEIRSAEAPYDLVKKMRASFTVLGPLLARKGYAKVAMPGGCDIGARPIDFHVKGIQALGAHVETGHGYVEAETDRLRGAEVYLDFPSAGATQHIMTAASLAKGITIIQNAAIEPEIVDLANFLNGMGARVLGAGTNVIRIDGVRQLKGTEHNVIPDRIEAGTYLVAGAITGGQVTVENVVPEHLKAVIAKLREAGAQVEEGYNSVTLRSQGRPRATDVRTMPYPGFPTDMQAQIMALLSLADGCSLITETVFESRFSHVEELKRMGANIKIEGRSAVVRGVKKLSGAPVKATDLRAGAGLVLAALAAEGRSEISGVFHLDRGYTDLGPKLQSLGADVTRVAQPVPVLA